MDSIGKDDDELAQPPALPAERRLILIDGPRDWTLQVAHELISRLTPERMVWISNDGNHQAIPPGQRIPPSKVQRLLGSECDLLAIDAWSGLDADALGAAAGSLRGGGLMLLLAPKLEDWRDQVDPEAARIAAYPFGAADIDSAFLGRLIRLLSRSPAALTARSASQTGRAEVRLRAGPVVPSPVSISSTGRTGSRHTAASDGAARYRSAAPQPAEVGAPRPAGPGSAAAAAERVVRALASAGFLTQPARTMPDPAQPATTDQADAIDAIMRLANGRARRPLVLTADRGRGKSAALGIAAARLCITDGMRVLVTAPRRSATEALFSHVDAVSRCAAAEADGSVRFIAPDELLDQQPWADLLLVDEAAGIPAPLLEQMLEHYRRICFATTIHGYEGTGRGFEVRFRGLLDQRTPAWRGLRLKTPIRWRQDDPLETLINRLLLLDAEPAADEQVAAADLGAIRVEHWTRSTLARDEDRLRQLFGLLVLGHYQTRPNDLRHLLDGPTLSVTTLSTGNLVVATALVAREGALETSLHQPVFDGRRRPRGHLLPQTLSAHAGLFDAPGLQFARIVRIAVHPAAQRHGLGRRLVDAIADQAAAEGTDLVGASFGATPGLLAFWRRCGLRPLHLGVHRNAASGARAAVALKPLNSLGQDLCGRAEERLRRDLPVLLSGPLSTVEPAIISSLLAEVSAECAPLEPQDGIEIDAFANAHRTLEASLPALARLAWCALTGERVTEQAPPVQQRELLIRVLLQRQHPAAVATPLGLSGRAELLERLREAVAIARDIVNRRR
ncbi:tRNA(Met) cytidine acetyltransferase TmcA [Halochromatium glycolicum]|uniref:tRNA(Met) cytidine acetyltransferase TmcA n=1 Tax=Halochromatium glycolicum TaxID=85075 RepID=A0AAJ0U393_9GAMM|nr:GNAT family N-acetyltransferase [Halochromatium glycolicum]MBK1704483.1 hypothetical protein [Halochromatium glycolicum]